MGFFGDMWQGVKNFGNAMNPIQMAQDFMSDPLGSMASTMTGGAGMLVNAISGSSDAKTWEETPWYDRLATTIKAKRHQQGKKKRWPRSAIKKRGRIKNNKERWLNGSIDA